MFPLPILTYVKMAAAVAALAFSWYLGYSFEASRFDRYKADQVLETQKLKDEHQAAADKIEKDKNYDRLLLIPSAPDNCRKGRRLPNRSERGNLKGGSRMYKPRLLLSPRCRYKSRLSRYNCRLR